MPWVENHGIRAVVLNVLEFVAQEKKLGSKTIFIIFLKARWLRTTEIRSDSFS